MPTASGNPGGRAGHERGQASSPVPPPHPLTLDGTAVLHQMFRVKWPVWRALDGPVRARIAEEAASLLAGMEAGGTGGSALFSMLGHKGDLLLLHFRRDLEELNRAELAVSSLELFGFLEPTTSYVSFVELGLYDSTVKLYDELISQGVAPGSRDWAARVRARVAEQAAAMAPRLSPHIPSHKYLCFYPMDKKRGEERNWFTVPIAERRDMMREHGMIGRRYAGRVRQIISGSIGFDDWEWGVDLFADDPLVFKQLIYEMRFDEASAVYALFGPFYISLRLPVSELGSWLNAGDVQFGTS